MSQTEPVARLQVALGTRAYDIVVGRGLIAQAGSLIRDAVGDRPLLVVADEAVAAAGHLQRLERALGPVPCFTVPSGESSKSLARFEHLLEALLEHGVERSSVLVALGGGVIGDLAGFAAAVVLRGIDFIQIPTTLLAQVDSAVGGKTGINAKAGKNLIGAFHQPRLVLADTDTLETLSRRELRAGYAEVVKYGLLGDAAFFTWLETHGSAIIDGDADATRHAIVTSCRAKADVVARDEQERAGARALLNLGHTFGHAFEREAGYGGDVLHGEAISVGMICAFELSRRMGLCPADDVERVRRHFETIGLPVDISQLGRTAFDPERLMQAMAKDKKVHQGRLTYVLVHGIGQAFLHDHVDSRLVSDLLDDMICPA